MSDIILVLIVFGVIAAYYYIAGGGLFSLAMDLPTTVFNVTKDVLSGKAGSNSTIKTVIDIASKTPVGNMAKNIKKLF